MVVIDLKIKKLLKIKTSIGREGIQPSTGQTGQCSGELDLHYRTNLLSVRGCVFEGLQIVNSKHAEEAVTGTHVLVPHRAADRSREGCP